MIFFQSKTNLRHGTNCLNPDELIRVIEACGRLGVSHIKLGTDTEITFSATPQIMARPNSPELTRAQEKLTLKKTKCVLETMK